MFSVVSWCVVFTAQLPAAANNGAEDKPNAQLEINREALFKGPEEQIRLKAASLMLFSSDRLARKILIGALRQSENTAARVAVCKALSRARAEHRLVEGKADFISPLFEVLATEQEAETAKLAAEATLIFEYRQISKELEKLITDDSLGSQARLNAVAALKVQPDKGAILKLMDLSEADDKPTALASEKALQSLGILVAGKGAKARREIRDEIEQKGKDAFLRDRLIRQDNQMRELEKESQLWQKLYLSSLDTIYTGMGEDTVRGEFLAKRLTDSKAVVRLWALEKVNEWLKGTNSQLPAGLGPVLLELIPDQDRDVRLKTAKLLSFWVNLNSAEKLFEQLKVEQDDGVRIELLVALGGACHYALLPNSGITISLETRKQVLAWAADYLAEPDPKKARIGAEIIKKLLEQDGLTPLVVDEYLGLLVKKYNNEKDNTEAELRSGLLNVMAALCAQSVYKDKSAQLFRPLFLEALSDRADIAREAAVDGLININKAKALMVLRDNIINENSVIIARKVIGLAGEVGGDKDLEWLWAKSVSGDESGRAWQAMLKIFEISNAEVLARWMGEFDSQKPEQISLSDDQQISFLEIAGQKADRENKPDMLKTVRGRLAELYMADGKYEKAVGYLGLLHQTALSPEEKEAISDKLVEAYLKWPNIELAVPLIANRLSEKDLEPESFITSLLDDYFAAAPVSGADHTAILEALEQIKLPQGSLRPNWQKQLKLWAEPKETTVPEESK